MNDGIAAPGWHRRLLREPLLHFLLLGGLLFLAHSLLNPGGTSDDYRRIVVDEDARERLAQAFMLQWRRPPDSAELAALVDEHVREEVLYREAMRLGLDLDDAVIRRRLAQKMEALAMINLGPISAPGEEELRRHFADRSATFATAPERSFSHVYLDPGVRGPGIREDAGTLLRELRAGGGIAPAGLGDTAPVARSFEGLTQREAARVLGRHFAEQLFALPLRSWQGPVESGYGLHLVFVSESTTPAVPDFEEVRDDLTREYLEDRHRALRSAMLDELKGSYEVVVSGEATAATP